MDSFDKARIHSDEWFKHAFNMTDAPEWMKKAAEHICRSYSIKGQADPAYIANTISTYFEDREHSHGNYSDLPGEYQDEIDKGRMTVAEAFAALKEQE
jgi:hypothetical protein